MIVLIVVLAAALVSASGAGAAQRTTGHTKRQAEINILHATKMLRRWRVPFLNHRTNTVRSNTRVNCTGKTRGAAGRYKSFLCTISYRTVHVRLRYIAQPRNGFSVLRLPAPRPKRA